MRNVTAARRMPGATDSGDVLGRNVAQTCLLQLSGIGAVQHATFSSFLFWQFICSSSDVTWSRLSVLQPSAQLRDQERGRRLGRTGIGKRRGKKKKQRKECGMAARVLSLSVRFLEALSALANKKQSSFIVIGFARRLA